MAISPRAPERPLPWARVADAPPSAEEPRVFVGNAVSIGPDMRLAVCHVEAQYITGVVIGGMLTDMDGQTFRPPQALRCALSAITRIDREVSFDLARGLAHDVHADVVLACRDTPDGTTDFRVLRNKRSRTDSTAALMCSFMRCEDHLAQLRELAARAGLKISLPVLENSSALAD